MPDAKRPTSSVAAEIEEQRGSNASAVEHFDAFGKHRAKLTDLVLDGVSREAEPRLCVLGAGNCYDLDLARLAATFREIHLVDLDPAALIRASDRLDAISRAKIVRHAPVDLSGLLDRLERWRAFQVQPQELMEYPARASRAVVERLPGPFDVVLSSCLLTQMQLTILNVLSAEHRLFEATRHLANLAHLRTMAALLAPSGRGLLVTDVATDADYPFAAVTPDFDGLALLGELLTAGRAISTARPDLLAWTAREDPLLKQSVSMSAPLDAWLWHNGPGRIFLVYAVELRATTRS